MKLSRCNLRLRNNIEVPYTSRCRTSKAFKKDLLSYNILTFEYDKLKIEMKTKLTFICLTILATLTSSCDENISTKSESVENYIRLLKSNQYRSDNLPLFTYQDIPFLLEYRNETQLITNYPRNMISSYYQPECALGMYVLWTIESIRAISINSTSLMQRFPSQNPILALKNSTELKLVSDNTSHSIVAKAYSDWWTSNKNIDFNTFKNIDPLEKTDYKWH